MSRSVSAPSSVTKTSPCWNGFIVPGSTLRYGSSFCIVTRRPRAVSSWPRLEAVSPLPSEEATPPVTNTCLVVRAGCIVSPPTRSTRGPFGRCPARSLRDPRDLTVTPRRPLARVAPPLDLYSTGRRRRGERAGARAVDAGAPVGLLAQREHGRHAGGGPLEAVDAGQPAAQGGVPAGDTHRAGSGPAGEHGSLGDPVHGTGEAGEGGVARRVGPRAGHHQGELGRRGVERVGGARVA